MRPEDIERIKELLPTTLGSAEIRAQVAADILRRSIFSARMASVPYLAKLREVCAAISAGEINQADARARLLAVLEQLGLTGGERGERGERGGEMAGERGESSHRLTNPTFSPSPASIRRLNLIIDTQRQMAASVARLMGQTEATTYANPAWELTRLGHRDAPRADWIARWRAAGDSVGWEGALEGRFIALKSSPIWTALGDGAGGFDDTLGNPYPPFAYGSGMGWVAVDRAECERLGLVGEEAKARGEGEDKLKSQVEVEERTGKIHSSTSTSNFNSSLSPDEQSLADAVERYGFPEIAEGILA